MKKRHIQIQVTNQLRGSNTESRYNLDEDGDMLAMQGKIFELHIDPTRITGINCVDIKSPPEWIWLFV